MMEKGDVDTRIDYAIMRTTRWTIMRSHNRHHYHQRCCYSRVCVFSPAKLPTKSVLERAHMEKS